MNNEFRLTNNDLRCNFLIYKFISGRDKYFGILKSLIGVRYSKTSKSLKPPMGQITSTLFDGGYLIKVSKATDIRNLSEFIEKHKLSKQR